MTRVSHSNDIVINKATKEIIMSDESIHRASSFIIPRNKDQIVQAHLSAVLKENKNLNLTSIETLEAGAILHIEDSLTALRMIESAPEGSLADIGSGAGYPGIPLAIYCGRRTFLIESIRKKASFLERVINSLGLEDQITAINMRAEELAIESSDNFSVITTRALGELPAIIELAAPLLRSEGILVAFKGRPDISELERGKRTAELLGMQQEEIQRITLSDGQSQRTLISYKKVEQAKVVLPRRPGMARKKPLF